MSGGGRAANDPRFGEGSAAPTEFEEELLRDCDNLDDLWVAVAKRIGLAATFEVFDELGSMIVSVPTRRSFVKRLYIPRRDQEILELYRQRVPKRELVKRYAMSPDSIDAARRRALRTRGRRR